MHYTYVRTCMVRPQELDEKDSIQNKHLSIAVTFGLLSSLVEERGWLPLWNTSQSSEGENLLNHIRLKWK